MFNDFKIRTYSNTPNKLRILKDIFDRLNLFNFKERLNILSIKIDMLKKEIETILSGENRPTEYGFGEFLIVHAHNPEGKEIGGLVYLLDYFDSQPSQDLPPHDEDGKPFYTLNLQINKVPKIYIDNRFIGITATNVGEHNFPFKLSNYGILPGYHTCTVIFNGMAKSIRFYAPKNSVNHWTFNFDRIDAPISYEYDYFDSPYKLPDDSPMEGSYFYSPEQNLTYAELGYTKTPPLKTRIDFIRYVFEPPENVVTLSTKYFLDVMDFEFLATMSGHQGSIIDLVGTYYSLLPLIPFPITGLMPSEPIQIDILPQESFIEWWCQGLQTGFYPDLTLLPFELYTDGWAYWEENLPPTIPPTYHIKLRDRYTILNTRFPTDDNPKMSSITVPASLHYKNLNFSFFPDYHDWTSNFQGRLFSHENVERDGHLLNGGLKISSVPYDIEGTSF